MQYNIKSLIVICACLLYACKSTPPALEPKAEIEFKDSTQYSYRIPGCTDNNAGYGNACYYSLKIMNDTMASIRSGDQIAIFNYNLENDTLKADGKYFDEQYTFYKQHPDTLINLEDGGKWFKRKN